MADSSADPTLSQESSAGGTRLRRALTAIAKTLVVGLLLYFVYRHVSNNWDEIRATAWTVDFSYLIPSILIGLVTFTIMASVWRGIIGAFGFRLRVREAFRIIYLSDLGRYIPGKVWQLFGVLYLARQKGIPPEQAGASFVLAQMFAIPASFLVFVVAAQIEPSLLVDQVSFLGEKASYLITGLMAAFCAALVLVPQRVLALSNRLLRRLRRPEVCFQLDKRVALYIFVGYCIGWICYGVAFWLFVEAVVPDSQLGLIAAVGLFNAAYQIGYLTLIAPGGLGPRELVMGVLLSPFVGPIGSVVALAARLWAIVVESLAALLALTVGKK